LNRALLPIHLRAETAAVDDTISICCPKCKGSFRDKAMRVLGGYSRQCPSCEVVLFFEEYTQDKDIKRAMTGAKQVRHKMQVEELERAETKRRSYYSKADAPRAR
jgi:hypothetical protein